MRSLAVVVPKVEGEATRRRLDALGLLRRGVRPVVEGAEIRFAIDDPPDGLRLPGRVDRVDFDDPADAPPSEYRSLLDLPADESRQLPRSFDVLGDVVLIRIPAKLERQTNAIGEALLRFVPGCRVVGWDKGVRGPDRVRELVRIAGTGGWRTTVRENGLDFAVDPERAYFSPRLGREHARVAEAVGDGEIVYDLAAGVGPFALTIARGGRARSVIAVERNPAAVELLNANLKAAHPTVPVDVVEGPLERFLPSAGACDRAILNLPHEGIKYLASVAEKVAPRGAIHYYEMTARTDEAERSAALESGLSPAGDWTVEERHVVHPYSPRSDLVAYRLVRRAR